MNALNDLDMVKIIQGPEFSKRAQNSQKFHFWPKNETAQDKS